jgi:leader peptidase (prepilin peptidase)/N-methyltransferase
MQPFSDIIRDVLVYVSLFAAGLALSVLVNSLADNLPPDADDQRHPPRRPHCHQCHNPHAPVFWLALAALVARGGRCEHCGARRRLRPAVIELVSALGTAGIWAWVLYRSEQAAVPWSWLRVIVQYLSALWVFQTFLLIAVVDIEHRLILWSVVWPTALGVAAMSFVLPDRGVIKTMQGGLAGYGFTFGIFLLAEGYSRLMHRLRGQPLDEVAFGGGDVNLAGIVGLAVGWPGIVLSLLIAVLTGGIVSLVYIVVQLARRRYSPHAAMPYGPFLVLGGWLIYFVGRDLATIWPNAP